MFYYGSRPAVEYREASVAIAITEDQRALAESVRAWATDAGESAYATGLATIGLYGVAVPGSLGGAGGSVADLAVGLARVATRRRLVSVRGR